jgi:hypothetical protein
MSHRPAHPGWRTASTGRQEPEKSHDDFKFTPMISWTILKRVWRYELQASKR